MRTSEIVVGAGIALLALVPAGCQGGSLQMRGLGTELEGARLSDRQLRLQLHEFARRFAAVVEAAADDVAEGADPEVQAWARELKLHTISSCQSAVLDADPYLAYVDTVALVRQLEARLRSDDVAELLGSRHARVVAAANALVAEATAMAEAAFTPEFLDETRGVLVEWAAEHPMEPSFARPSPSAQTAATMTDRDVGALATARSIDGRIEDLSDRITLILELLPRQARWQAEVLVSQAAEDAFDGIDRVLDEVRAIVAEERAVVLGEVEARTTQTLAEVDRQRAETLAEVERQVDDAFVHVGEQRRDTLEFARAEREAVVAAVAAELRHTEEWIARQREEATADLGALAGTLVRDTARETQAVLDRTLLFVFLGGLVYGVLGLAALLVVLRLRSPGTGS